MRIVFSLIFIIIRAAFCGYITKTINESKGYSGGFWMGAILVELGILIAVFKKELPDAPPNSYRAAPIIPILKKYHYPFVSPKVEPIDILKGSIYAETEAAKVNLLFLIFHGMFLYLWYGTIMGIYLWYIIGYTIHWMFKYKIPEIRQNKDLAGNKNGAVNPDKISESLSGLKDRVGSTVSELSQKTEDLKASAAEQVAMAREKAENTLAELKENAAAAVSERKKADDADKVMADINDPVQEAPAVSDAVEDTADHIEEVLDTESFDELYEKAMNGFNENEADDVPVPDKADDAKKEFISNKAEAAVAAPPVYQPPEQPAPAQPQPVTAQYAYEDTKKSPLVFVLAGIVVVLLVGIGILGGMLVMKNKGNKELDARNNINSDNSGNSEVIMATTENAHTETSAASSQVTTSETTTATQYTTTEAPTTTQEATTEEKADVSGFSAEAIENARNRTITDLTNYLASYDNSNGYVPPLTTTTDHDINGDGTPELIISFMGISGDTYYYIYYYDGTQFIELKECWGGLEISEKNHLLHETHYGGGEAHDYYEVSDNYELTRIDEISTFPTSTGYDYYRNGKQIDSSEYCAAENYYKDMNWISIESDFKMTVADSGNTSENKPQNNESDSSGNKVVGKVVTQNDPLNMREEPSSDSGVIFKIPRGDYVEILANNGDWLYVKYYKDENSPVYTGYVSSQFIEIRQ